MVERFKEKILKPEIAFTILSVLLLFHALYFNYVEDDVFTCLRYSRNLAEGNGIVFNQGARVEGCVDFVYLVLMAALIRLGLDPVLWSQIIGFILGVGVLYATYRISCLLSGGKSSINYIAPLFLVSNAPFSVWTIGGKGTTLFVLVFLWGVYEYLKQQKNPGGFPKFALIFAFLSIVRLEGVALFTLTLAHYALISIWGKRRIPYKRLLLIASVYAVVFLPYFIWRFSYFGYLLPNPFYGRAGAGMAYQLIQYRRGLSHLGEFVRDFGGVIFFIPVILYSKKNNTLWLTYLTALILFYFAYIVYLSGDSSAMYRYFVPILPLFYILVQETFRFLYQNIRPSDIKTWAVITLLLAACVLFTTTPSFFGLSKKEVFIDNDLFMADRIVIGKWLHENMKNETIALNAIGAVSYYSELPIVDMLGLTEVNISHNKRKIKDSSIPPGHEKYDSEYVLSKNPSMIMLGPTFLTDTASEEDFLKTYFFPSDKDMLSNPEFRERYDFTSVGIGDKFFVYYKRV